MVGGAPDGAWTGSEGADYTGLALATRTVLLSR